jgi:endoglucanase
MEEAEKDSPLHAYDPTPEFTFPLPFNETVYEHDTIPQRHVGFGRRALLAGFAVLPATQADAAPTLPAKEWQAFKLRFLSPDGRIIDTGNGGISHSEGQGWGMLLALAAEDQAAFSLIQNWTARNLARPTDALHAWRFVPNDNPPIKDRNNATDGDIFIAAALAGAGRLWGQTDWLQAAASIARDILGLLVRRAGPYRVLLPGLLGFESRDAVVINLSYYAFPFLTELASLVPSAKWETVMHDGRTLIDRGRFGSWGLPPDWLQIASTSGALTPAPGRPPRFSFDAVRVPLWNAWAGLPNRSAMRAIDGFWSAYPTGETPAWIDLKTGEVAPYRMTPGMLAIAALLRSALRQPPLQSPPALAAAGDYYDAVLILLSAIGGQEMLSR